MEAVSRRAIFPCWAVIVLSAVFFLLVPARIHGSHTPSALLSDQLIPLSQHSMAHEEWSVVYPGLEHELHGKGVVSNEVVRVRPLEGGVDHGHRGTSGRSHSWRG